MKKVLTVATVVIMAALSAHGQTRVEKATIQPCELKQAPAVRGIRLGMTTEDLLALFPGSASENGISQAVAKAANYPNFGVTGMQINPSHYSTKERFAGIGYLNFLILDGRLAQFEVNYLGPAPYGPTWRNIDDFITKITDAFELPAAKNWTAQAYNPSTKELKCDGFQLSASNVNLRGSFTVATIDAPFKVQQQRLATFEEKARRDFRP